MNTENYKTSIYAILFNASNQKSAFKQATLESTKCVQPVRLSKVKRELKQKQIDQQPFPFIKQDQWNSFSRQFFSANISSHRSHIWQPTRSTGNCYKVNN